MNADSADVEPEQVVPDYWRATELMVVIHLAHLGADEPDARAIAENIFERCAHIPAAFADKIPDSVFDGLSVLVTDMVTAAQRLFAARTGRMPGQFLSDWPPTPIAFDHPMLIDLRRVISQIEAEANEAEGGRRMN